VTDAGLAHLRGMKGLRELCLWDTAVTDDGLKYLAGLTRLRTLWLVDTKVTGAGLNRLAGLPDLEEVHLPWGAFRDEHLAGLKLPPKLTDLDLRGPKVTDAGLAHLKGQKQLRSEWHKVKPHVCCLASVCGGPRGVERAGCSPWVGA
jgi:internalin A